MKVSQTIIKEVDLEKLMKESGYKSYRQLCKDAGVSYENFLTAKNGHRNYSLEGWNKIKNTLNICKK